VNSSVDGIQSLVTELIGRRSHDVIARLTLSRGVIGRKDCKKEWLLFDPLLLVKLMSFCLSLVQVVGLSIVCLSC